MNAGHPAPGSPVGSATSYWKFDEGAGTTAYDGSVNANNLTLSSATSAWTNNGKYGKAWNGDGVLYLSRANDDDFDVGTADFTFSFWFKSDNSGGSGTQYIINRASSTIAGFAIYGNSSGNIVFAIDDDTTWTPDDTVTSTANLYDQAWHHIVAVKTGTSKMELFVDGKLDKDNQNLTATGSLSNDLTFYLGDRDGTNNGDEFIGDLDEVKFYRAAMTSDQVKTEYNQGKAEVMGSVSTTSAGIPSQSAQREYCPPGNTETNCGSGDPSPVGEWHLNENTGTQAIDTGVNKNNGTFDTGIVSWAMGKFGAGVHFGGINNSDIEMVGSETSLGMSTIDFTLEAWEKLNSGNTVTLPAIIQKGATANSKPGYWLYYDDSSAFEVFKICCKADNTRATVNGTTNLKDNKWHHITVTVQRSGNATIYVDGRVDNSGSVTTISGDITGIDPFHISGNSSNTPWFGELDEVKAYNYIRTPSQIAWDMNRGKPEWGLNLDQTSGTTANDSGKLAINGTLQGGAAFDTTSGNCKFSNCVDLTTTSHYINTASFTPLAALSTTISNVSWGGWYYLTSTVNSLTLFEKATELQLSTDSSGHPICSIYNGGAFQNSAASVTALTTSTWNHVFCTYDGVNIKTYLNGLLVKTTPQTATITAASSAAYVGRASGGTGNITGRVDEQYIFTYPLTLQQVQAVYNQNSATSFHP